MNSIRHLDWLEIWDRYKPGSFPAIPTAEFSCFIRVKCEQKDAAVALAYLITRVIDEITYISDFWGRDDYKVCCPKVVGFAHVIQGDEHYALLLFDESAQRAYEQTIFQAEGAVFGSLLGDIVRSQPPSLATGLSTNHAVIKQVAEVYL